MDVPVLRVSAAQAKETSDPSEKRGFSTTSTGKDVCSALWTYQKKHT